MVCIYCGSKTEVINSRLRRKANQIWRRRRCLGCKGVFTTTEAVDWSSSLLFRIDTEHVKPFQRDILFISVYESSKHRTDALSAATALTDTILGKLRPKVTNATIDRTAVVSVTTNVLRHFDKAAGTAYRAYHPL